MDFTDLGPAMAQSAMNDRVEKLEKQAATPQQDDGWTWARVEIFGHTKHYGRVREEDKIGVKMLRIDVPFFQHIRGIGEVSEAPLRWETSWYSAASIFSLAVSDEESVMKANKPYESPYRQRLAYEPQEKNIDLEAEPTDDTELPF